MSHECVTDGCLREHLGGQLHGEEEARVIAHLDACDRCQATLDGLAADTLILNVARESGRVAPKCDPTLDRLLTELQDSRGAVSGATCEAHDHGSAIEPETFERLGHYTVLEVAGRGGMGVALKARDEKLDRLVCLKIFAGPAAVTESARQRWLREARAAAAVQSEHVVKIYAVEEHEGRPLLAMEFVSGRSLQEELDRRGPLPLAEVLQIARQAAVGLAAAHAQGLVHRDVKPGNILLENGTNKAKIADFGMARALDDARLTSEGCVAGTPEYMAPEQALGESVDHRADLFSLGSVLYAMCTGRSPFAASSSLAVLRRIIDDVPLQVKKLRSDTPLALVRLIGRLHEKQPSRRPQSAQEVLELLALCEAPHSPLRLSRRAMFFVAGAALVGTGSIAGILRVDSGDGSRRLPDDRRMTPGLTSAPPPPSASRAARMLVVLPPREFYGLYYLAVRRQLDPRHIKYQVASTSMLECTSSSHFPTVTVKPNLMIDYARGGDYDLIYFCGGVGCNIYAAGGSHAGQAKRIIEEALRANRIVAAMGMASVILAEADVLRGRKATSTHYGEPPGQYIERLEAAGVHWQDAPWIEDGPFLTGRDASDVQQFVAAMLNRLGAPPRDRALPPPSD